MYCAGCESYIKYDHPDCPVCEECYASDEHLDSHCATNFEGEREALHIEAQERLETQENLNRYEATKCLTCGIYFIHPEYGEHIKTCCP